MKHDTRSQYASEQHQLGSEYRPRDQGAQAHAANELRLANATTCYPPSWLDA
jgi:hypothetical protein